MFGFYATCFLFVILVLGTILRLVTGISIFKLLKYLGKWTGEFDKDRADLVLSGKDPFDEVAFAAGDDHGGGAWDEELAEMDVDLTDTRALPVGANR